MIRDGGDNQAGKLKRGWTTGACATAATKAALTALITRQFPNPVSITLPKGESPNFSLCYEKLNVNGAYAGIVKDAGDDPDVTHGATIIAHVIPLPSRSGIVFKAGLGVGTITKSGLPLPPGEPAINPVPRQMIQNTIKELCNDHQLAPDFQVTITVPGGKEIAKKTWNPRLGIIGGISILGTTGVVHPFSCSAWIHSIRYGIDVARSEGFEHVIAATGSTSEITAQSYYHLPETAIIDMGDFAGGLLKYLHTNPIPRLTIALGFAKAIKFAKGALDLHSGRSQVDLEWLLEIITSIAPERVNQNFKNQIFSANTIAEILKITQNLQIELPQTIARLCHETAQSILRDAPISVEIIITNRQGEMIAQYDSE
ncbi:cobalt-precorrin-5B (C(1))-methyltransferase [Candidatus Endowatersipora endosymbiont of Watersipora subatra]|uniref:cobalt-precorrin-5B (C(1))-methyltransferase n=1 Tax=Candidatus Endowatersipora endosymbiont of Watersipora subatra TaxID=3077946 RepID=UPI00312C8FD2